MIKITTKTAIDIKGKTTYYLLLEKEGQETVYLNLRESEYTKIKNLNNEQEKPPTPKETKK